MSDPILLITGATGNQGGATIAELLRRPKRWHVRALVRDPAKPAAKVLAAQGITLVHGDLNDDVSLRSALIGAHGVLAVQTPMGQGPEGEARQGKQFATLAAEAGVRHFVQCSAAGVDRDSGVPHFESKRVIEAHIAALGLPATVPRPAAFMENFRSFAFRTTMLSMMKTYLAENRTMQLASARDVGWFAAEAFEWPDAYIGKAIEIAGDSVTRRAAVRTLRATGHRPVAMFTIPGFLRRRLPKDFRLMFEWIAREGFAADITALRRCHPGLLTLSAWAAHSDTKGDN